MTTQELAAYMAGLITRKNKVEAGLKLIKEEIEKTEKQLKDLYIKESVQGIKVTGSYGDHKAANVYMYRQLWASAPDPEKLRNTPFGWLVKDSVNSTSLSAEVRQLPENDNGMPILPEDVDPESIVISEVFKIGVKFS